MNPAAPVTSASGFRPPVTTGLTDRRGRGPALQRVEEVAHPGVLGVVFQPLLQQPDQPVEVPPPLGDPARSA